MSDYDVVERDRRAQDDRTVFRQFETRCARVKDGDYCFKPVELISPFYCDGCLRPASLPNVRRRLVHEITVLVDIWRDKLGLDIHKELMRAKRATARINMKLSPMPTAAQRALHDYCNNLVAADGRQHVTKFDQTAGSRGGETRRWEVDIVSGKLLEVAFRRYFVHNTEYFEGPVHRRVDGNIHEIRNEASKYYKWLFKRKPSHSSESFLRLLADKPIPRNLAKNVDTCIKPKEIRKPSAA